MQRYSLWQRGKVAKRLSPQPYARAGVVTNRVRAKLEHDARYYDFKHFILMHRDVNPKILDKIYQAAYDESNTLVEGKTYEHRSDWNAEFESGELTRLHQEFYEDLDKKLASYQEYYSKLPKTMLEKFLPEGYAKTYHCYYSITDWYRAALLMQSKMFYPKSGDSSEDRKIKRRITDYFTYVVRSCNGKLKWWPRNDSGVWEEIVAVARPKPEDVPEYLRAEYLNLEKDILEACESAFSKVA